MTLQNFEMRSTGVGWKAEACRDPRGCEEGLCVQDAGGHHWHPADPLAFAKWRVRARLADIPAHVLVTTTGGRGRDSLHLCDEGADLADLPSRQDARPTLARLRPSALLLDDAGVAFVTRVMQNDNDSGTRTDKKATVGDALHDLARAGPAHRPLKGRERGAHPASKPAREGPPAIRARSVTARTDQPEDEAVRSPPRIRSISDKPS